jgi:hypothetical protein
MIRLVGTLFVLLFTFLTSSVQAQRGRAIRSVDFRNFTYEILEQQVRLRNGKWEGRDVGAGHDDADLVAVRYVDFDGDGQEEAAVDIHAGVNGMMRWEEEYFVFAYRNGTPQQIFHEEREQGTKMNIIGKSIIISAPSWEGTDAHCCPSAIAVETYAWRGSRFVRISRRLRPSPK